MSILAEYQLLADINNRIAVGYGLRNRYSAKSVLRGVMYKIQNKEPIWFEKCEGVDGPCDSIHAYRRRQDTKYEDDCMNYRTLCDECQAANDKHWAEQWREYYAGRM